MANRVNLDVSERLDITCRKGDTFSLTVTIKDSSGVVLPLVTNNYSFLMQVWGNSKKSFEPFVLDDSGNVTITATAATMRVVNPGKYTYDLQYVLPTSSGVDTHTTVLKGSFIINEDTSKSV